MIAFSARRPLALLCIAALVACGDDDDAPPAPVDAGAIDAGSPAADAATCARDLPDAAVRAAIDLGPADPGPLLDCGTPTFAESTGLRRRPYLQSIGQRSARVAWTTTTGGRGAVEWSTSAAGPWTRVEATEEMFDTTRTADTEAYVAYDATLATLEPNQRYCYRIVEGATELASGLALDTSWSGTERPVRLIAFGDSGQSTEGQFDLRDVMLTQDFDVFLHLGDIAYPDGTFTELEQHFFTVYADVLHQKPVFPTLGNHEYGFSPTAQPYRDMFYLPEMALKEDDQERYYSFDYGNVHFIVLDSNERTLLSAILDSRRDRNSDDMFDWAADDLAASSADWKIAIFHHPPFSSSERGIDTTLIDGLTPLLEAGGVDLVLTGHDHHYERITSIRGGCAAPRAAGGIDYLLAGAGGAGLRPASGDWFTLSKNDAIHSFVRLEIRGCTAHGETLAADGTVVDTFTLDGCPER